jgi:hypothetical protein
MKQIASDNSQFSEKMAYGISFFFLVNVLSLHIIFGIIIDSFAELRSEQNKRNIELKNFCFICGAHKDEYERQSLSFRHHIVKEHNIWFYIFFIVGLE